jgi:hypothetical protein
MQMQPRRVHGGCMYVPFGTRLLRQGALTLAKTSRKISARGGPQSWIHNFNRVKLIF